ncbi:hypothetical protein [Halobacillus naozhouensis]|uniref:Uncharacterized protein n=1 Tax=Halobacillus naozhouensis TaxID=554880 RepID=A0ABY8IXL7_9BACI|nr:hypothetical protein [Halobacillus naozhouensis]WFT74521.1 hypothetical protein P9989_19555 [Halobacillus naozhouensis]
MNFTLGFLVTYTYYLITLLGASYLKTGGEIWSEIFQKQVFYGLFVTWIGCAIADLLIKGSRKPVLPMMGLAGIVYGSGILLVFNTGPVPLLVLFMFSVLTSIGFMLFCVIRLKQTKPRQR